MSDYAISRIYSSDKTGLAQVDNLLQQENIERDKNLDYTVGLFDEDYNIVATGSCFKNTLRCFAVDHNHQGEGLLNQVISHLIEYQYGLGNLELFLYTKVNSAKFFGDIGFYEVARVEDKLVFMENRKNGFQNYLAALTQTKVSGVKVGAVVMNANPFTLGHRYLLEEASKACDVLHVFVVSEEASPIPFKVRYQLVREGSQDLKNIVYHETGSYIISSATFPSYFLKDSNLVIESQAKLDIIVFTKIAEALGINQRFVGEEPFSHVTSIYNDIMSKKLAEYNIACHIIPRKQEKGEAISASQVRQYLKEGEMAAVKSLVPNTTYNYFMSEDGQKIREKLAKIANVVHY